MLNLKLLYRSSLGVTVLLICGFAAVVYIAGGAGEAALEAYISEELKKVIDERLNPELQFVSLDYQAPLTVVLSGVRLTADDPDNPGQRVDMIDAKSMRIKLAQLPRKGKPIQLSGIELDGVSLRLINNKAGGLIGFSDMVKQTTGQGKRQLSEVLQITEIVIKNGVVEYDTRAPDTEPMRIDAINTVLQVDQAEGGTYGLDLTLTRPGVFDLKLKGDCDLDTMAIAVDSLRIDLDMSPKQDRYLPPQIQAFIKTHEITGKLAVDLTGGLNLLDLEASDASVKLELTDANGRFGEYRLPIKKLEVDAVMKDRDITVDRIAGTMLGGELVGEGTLMLSPDLPATLNLSGSDLDLRELVIAGAEDKRPPVAGIVALQVNAQAPLTDVLNKMTGKGELQLRDGRLARIPVLSNLIDVFESSSDEALDPEASKAGNDSADVTFELRGDHAYLSDAVINGSWFTIEAKGKVYFNERLSLKAKGGPIKKALSGTGLLGSAVGVVTDNLLTYRVSGTISEMTIRPDPLGGIFGAPGQDD